MRKSTFCLIDSETSQTGLVVDFAAVILDRKGNILNQCAILVHGIYDDPINHPLYFRPNEDDSSIWSMAGRIRRYNDYKRMVKAGTRMIATVPAINSWIYKATKAYDPILTAYNLDFDRKACAKTGIDLTGFNQAFCLMQASQTAYAYTRNYRQWVLEHHAFRPPTSKGNMSYKTDAETMAQFCSNGSIEDNEPHTALEDIIFFEVPILNKLTRRYSNKWLLTEPRPLDWKQIQVKDCFKPL